MIHWAWLIAAFLVGVGLASPFICLVIFASRDEERNRPLGGNGDKNRLGNPVDLYAKRRIIGLSPTRLK